MKCPYCGSSKVKYLRGINHDGIVAKKIIHKHGCRKNKKKTGGLLDAIFNG